jgi:hypothetical protein
MNIKWNWGTKLALWITVFILFMLGLVFMTIMNDVTLVEKDYYPKGLDYQNRINEMENAKLVNASFKVKQLENEIEIQFPNVNADSGTIYFFRPSNNQMDRMIRFDDSDNGVKHLDISDFHKGKYVMKISWKSANKAYYLEQVMTLR